MTLSTGHMAYPFDRFLKMAAPMANSPQRTPPGYCGLVCLAETKWGKRLPTWSGYSRWSGVQNADLCWGISIEELARYMLPAFPLLNREFFAWRQ
jgi:hypothetical protein